MQCGTSFGLFCFLHLFLHCAAVAGCVICDSPVRHVRNVACLDPLLHCKQEATSWSFSVNLVVLPTLMEAANFKL